MRNKKRVFMAILTMAVWEFWQIPWLYLQQRRKPRSRLLCNFLGTCTACSCHLSGSYYKRGIQFTVPGNSYGRASVSGFVFEGTVTHIFQDGIISVLSDSYNVGIFIFLVILGAMVCMMNKAGGSAAFGRWASKRIKTRVGAELASVVLQHPDLY